MKYKKNYINLQKNTPTTKNQYMSKPANAITFDRAINLIKLDPAEIKKIRGKQIYTTPIGRIYFRGSKDYGYTNINWWYTIDPKIIEEEQVDYLCLAADYYGIFLIPSQDFLNYRKYNNVTSVKGGRENFKILKEGDKLIRRESNCMDWDITKFFITN